MSHMLFDEAALLKAAQHQCLLHYRGARLEDLAARASISSKRLTQIVTAWVRRGWWEYQASLTGGYLTSAGLKIAREIAGVVTLGRGR